MEALQEIVRPSITQGQTSVWGENRCCYGVTLDCSFSVHYHGGSSITQQHYRVNDPWFFKLRSVTDPKWWQQKHNIFCYRLILSFKESTHSLETQKSYLREKGSGFFLLLPPRDMFIKGVFRYASLDLDWGRWEGHGNIAVLWGVSDRLSSM